MQSSFHTVTPVFTGGIGENRLTVERGSAVDLSCAFYRVYMRVAQLYVKHPVCRTSGDLHCSSAFRGYSVQQHFIYMGGGGAAPPCNV